MKKRWLVLLSLTAATLTLAIWIGPATAFFLNRVTEPGAEVTAGYLKIDVEAELTGYGIPGDVLKNGSLTVTNNSPIAVDYELKLTADPDTAGLLKDSVTHPIRLYDGTTSLDTDISKLENGSLVLIYNGTLPKNEVQQLSVELVLEGEALLDGNEFQKQPICLEHEVTAYQTKGD